MSLINTVGTYWAVGYGYMRKGFCAEGLVWSFYVSTESLAGWETSEDGLNWSGDFTSIGPCVDGRYFSVWFDGTHIHYVRYKGSPEYDLFYRRGTPMSNGTINWCQLEQTVYNGTSTNRYRYPCIAVDTNGYAWIGIYYDKPDDNDFPAVLKNDNLDGTWALDFIKELNAVDDAAWKVCPVPLTDGKVYVVYCRDNQLPLGNLWNGATWEGEENDLADYTIEGGYKFSVGAYGDNVHFTYNRNDTWQIRHNERVWDVGWNVTDVLVQDAVTIYCGPTLSIDTITGDLYCFWTNIDTDHVYYKRYTGATWGNLVDWIDESIDEIQFDYLCSSYCKDYDGRIGLLYTTKLQALYNAKFAYLSFMDAPTVTTQDATGIGKGIPP